MLHRKVWTIFIHLQSLSLFQGTRWIGGSLTPQWRFKSDQNWPKEKRKADTLAETYSETKPGKHTFRFHACKDKIKTWSVSIISGQTHIQISVLIIKAGQDFWIKTLSPIFVALLLCSWPLLWATIRRSLAEVSLSKPPNGWISFYVCITCVKFV